MTEQIQPQEYRTLHAEGDEIVDNGTRFANSLEELQADFADSNWAIIPAGEVPDNWRNMTIVDGVLVLASTEVIAAREVTRGIAETEAARQVKEARFSKETDPLLYDAMEAYATAHPEETAFVTWLTAKNAIRAEVENPKSI